MYILFPLGILIINSQNRIHSTIQKFTWGVHASTVNISNKLIFINTSILLIYYRSKNLKKFFQQVLHLIVVQDPL